MKSFFSFFSSARLMVALFVIYAICLAAATIVESSGGTELARRLFYNNWLFFGLQFVLIVNFALMSVRMRLWSQRKWGVLILHYGFVVVLVGAMTTFLFGREGLLHLREGEQSNTIINSKGVEIGKLPFSVTLDDFVLERYSGSGSPSSYESYLTIDGKKYHAYMNNVVYVGSYRLYQSSYDADFGGSVLTVNRDLAGTVVTYIGYILLLIGMLLSFFHNGSRFRALLRSLSVLTILFVVGGVAAQPMDRRSEQLLAQDYAERYAVPDSLGEKFGRLMVQTTAGRIEPVDTYARELLRKISRATTYRDLSANQVLLGLVSQGQVWSRVPFIKVQNDELLRRLGVTVGKSEIAFMDILDANGEYLLDSLVESTYAKSPSERSKFDKEVLKLDEKINILNAVFNEQFLALFPLEGDPEHHWYSSGDDLSAFQGQDTMVAHLMPMLVGRMQESVISGDWSGPSKIVDVISLYQKRKSDQAIYSSGRISAELLYNKLEIFKWAGFGYMTLGLLLIISVVVSLVTERRLKWLIITLLSLVVVIFAAQNFAMGLRWYISERAPWTNAYESMVYVGWAMALAGLLFVRRSKMTFALATFFAGVILFVSNLSWMDPQITPLVPVLKSYWLVVHVAVITASYGFFGIGFLLSVAMMILMVFGGKKLSRQITELCVINELSLWIGLCLMTAGTFLGAVWANESWGRYWGWDPKETWALITVIVYSFVLHARLVPWLRGEFKFAVMSIVALASVLMTFFGVNYYLTGLHSYGGDSAPPALNLIWIVYLAVAILAFAAWVRQRGNGRLKL